MRSCSISTGSWWRPLVTAAVRRSRSNVRDARVSRPATETVRAIVAGDFESIARRCHSLGIETETFCARAAREMVRTQRAKRSNAGCDRSTTISPRFGRSSSLSGSLATTTRPSSRRCSSGSGLRPAFETVYGCPLTPDGLSRRKARPTNIEAAIADLEAESALYVGDRAVDVRAADNAGLESALLSRSEDDDPTEMDAEPTYHLSSLSQLPAILR